MIRSRAGCVVWVVVTTAAGASGGRVSLQPLNKLASINRQGRKFGAFIGDLRNHIAGFSCSAGNRSLFSGSFVPLVGLRLEERVHESREQVLQDVGR